MAAQVLSRTWEKVLAVTVPFDRGRVVMIQSVSHAAVVLLPMPCPELIKTLIGVTGVCPSNRLALARTPISRRHSCCHSSGPSKCSSEVPFWPQG